MSQASGHSDQYHPSSTSATPPGSGANGRLHHVDHTYRDFSCYLPNGGPITKHKKSSNNFPAKLHQMLSEPLFSNSITWMPHGRAWKILDKGLLVTEGIPPYFSLTKFESFTRQLSSWGFKRLHRQGPDIDCYYHESFLRGIPELTVLMKRATSKQGKCAPHPEGEPDFYSISRSYPLPPTPVSMAHKESSPAVRKEANIHTPQSLPQIQAHDLKAACSHNMMPAYQALPKSLASASSVAVAMTPFTLMPPMHAYQTSTQDSMATSEGSVNMALLLTMNNVQSSETVPTSARESSMSSLVSVAQVASYHLPQPYHQTIKEPHVQDPAQRMISSTLMNCQPPNQNPLPPTAVLTNQKESSPAVRKEATTHTPQSLPQIQAHDQSVARSYNIMMPASQPPPKSLASASSVAVAMSPFTLIPPMHGYQTFTQDSLATEGSSVNMAPLLPNHNIPSSETVPTSTRESSTSSLVTAQAPAQVASYHSYQPYHQTIKEPQVKDPDQRKYLAAKMGESTLMNHQPPNQTANGAQDGSHHCVPLNSYQVDYPHASYPANYASTQMAMSNTNTQYYGGKGYTSYPIQGQPQRSSQWVESRALGTARQVEYCNHEENTRQEEVARKRREEERCFNDDVNASIVDLLLN